MARLNLVVGLGATGWSVVRFLKERGEECMVVDTRDNPPHLAELKECYPEVACHKIALTAEGMVEILPQVDRVVLSPGVVGKLTNWRELFKGAVVTSDVELFMQVAGRPVVAITGSNGKSTVTTLTGVLLKALGYQVAAGGNLGVPTLDLLNKQNDYYVLELSSFQLELIDNLQAAVAVLLNVTPDHMDHYLDFADYAKAKQRVFNGAKSAVVNSDSEQQPFYAGLDLPKQVLTFGGEGSDLAVRGSSLYYQGSELLRAAELKLHGQHNLYNVAASLAAVLGLNLPVDDAKLLEAAKNFAGLPHRMEFVAEQGGVSWYNDSKGTNVGATIAAIEGLAANLTGKVVLILGGTGKGADFSGMREAILKHARGIIFLGQDAPKIKSDLAIKEEELSQIDAKSLEEVVQQAKILAKAGDAVLFSPACASFDMFANFEQRGECFKQAVKAQLAK